MNAKQAKSYDLRQNLLDLKGPGSFKKRPIDALENYFIPNIPDGFCSWENIL